MNLFKERLQHKRPLTDRLFGKEISNLCSRRPSANRSFVQEPKAASSNPNRSCVLQASNKTTCTPRRVQELPADHSHAHPYQGEILSYLEWRETSRPSDLYSGQPEVTESMRAILVDWIAEVHYKLKLMPETLFLVVQLVDRYLKAKEVRKSKFQLLGVAAIFIAAKYEETYKVPSLKDLIYLSANTYRKEEILEMETSIMATVDFSIDKCSVLSFLGFYSRMGNLDDRDCSLAHYVCQLSLLEQKYNKYKASLLALSAVYLINKIRGQPKEFNIRLLEGAACNEPDVRSCAKALCELLQNVQSKNFTKTLRKKFGSDRYHEVSRIRIERKVE